MKRELSPAAAIFFDQVGIVLFYAVGIVFHSGYPLDELFTIEGGIHLFGGAFPFMLANFLAWAGLMLAQRFQLGFSGLIAWAGTVTVGLVFRFMNQLSIEPMFIVTSALFLAIIMFGWRAVAILVLTRRDATATQEA